MTIIQIQTEMNRPARIPLVTPGMPWISVTLLAAKYLSQVALRRGESQNMRHSWVVTVPLAVSVVLAHTSNAFHTKVRLPKMHALDKKKKKKNSEIWSDSIQQYNSSSNTNSKTLLN